MIDALSWQIPCEFLSSVRCRVARWVQLDHGFRFGRGRACWHFGKPIIEEARPRLFLGTSTVQPIDQKLILMSKLFEFALKLSDGLELFLIDPQQNLRINRG